MSDDRDLAPLDPALADLISAERAREPESAAVREAVRARVQGSLAAGATVGSAVHGARATQWMRRTMQWTALFAAGAVAGAAAHARFATPRERVVYVRTVVERVVPAAVPPSVPALDAGPHTVTAPTPVVPPSTARPEPPAASPASDLDAERALLERARTALVRGRADDALAAVEHHAQRFPRGQLAEERESMRVQALVAAGRYPEARAAGARFRQRFGEGLLWPVVDAALRSIP